MGVHLKEVKFHVEDDSWGNRPRYNLHGMIKVSAWVEVGNVLTESLDYYKEMEFFIGKLPKEVQEKLIDAYKDIQKFLDDNHEIKLKS